MTDSQKDTMAIAAAIGIVIISFWAPLIVLQVMAWVLCGCTP